MPIPLIGMSLAGILEAAAPWITRFIMVKGVLVVSGFLGRLGLVLATNEMLMQPLIDYAMNTWATMPIEWQCWFNLLGVTKGVSIILSGVTLINAKRVFFAKSS